MKHTAFSEKALAYLLAMLTLCVLTQFISMHSLPLTLLNLAVAAELSVRLWLLCRLIDQRVYHQLQLSSGWDASLWQVFFRPRAALLGGLRVQTRALHDELDRALFVRDLNLVVQTTRERQNRTIQATRTGCTAPVASLRRQEAQQAVELAEDAARLAQVDLSFSVR